MITPAEKIIAERRPSEILWAYWGQVVSIEENAERLAAEYLEAA